MDPPDGQNPVLDIDGSQQKGVGSVFQGGGSQLQVADLKAKVGELRSGGIFPNLTPVYQRHVHGDLILAISRLVDDFSYICKYSVTAVTLYDSTASCCFRL